MVSKAPGVAHAVAQDPLRHAYPALHAGEHVVGGVTDPVEHIKLPVAAPATHLYPVAQLVWSLVLVHEA